MQSGPPSFESSLTAIRIVVVVAHLHLAVWALRRWGRSRVRAAGIGFGLLVAACLGGPSDLLDWDQLLFGVQAPVPWQLAATVWVAGVFGTYIVCLAYSGWRRLGRFAQRRSSDLGLVPILDNPQPAGPMTRRVFATAVAAPFVMAGYGTFAGRKQFDLREIDMAIPGLAEDLDGLRVAQITDLHCSRYLSPADVERVVAMVNETRPHVTLVTGDLITTPEDPLEPCIDVLAGLKADSGVWGCLGNHERYALCEHRATKYAGARGIRFLRGEQEELRFGQARLNLAGVDYQRKGSPYLRGAKSLMRDDALNLLLSHNPDVFPVAADLGYDLVVSGHTHGGQVTVEIVEQWANPGRFLTPFVAGEYRIRDSALYVSRGIGTVNLPMRIGALPEVTLLRLRRA